MPNFGVRDAPSQISQASTQAALIQNTGTSTVYLDEGSSVSSTSYGLEVLPRQSVHWAAGRTLWAVCGSGDESTLSVLYGASGTTLSEVSAVVTGDVQATITGPVDAVIQGTVPVDVQNATINAQVQGNIIVDSGEVNVGGILTPVAIEGGGEGIVHATGTIAASGVVNIPVPVPASARTYYAFKITLSISSPQHSTTPRYISYIDTLGNNTQVARFPSSDFGVGITYVHEFTIPAQEAFFTVQLSNPGTLSTDYILDVSGVNVGSPTPQTNIGGLLNAAEPITITPPTVGGQSVTVWLPPSFNEYKCLMRTSSTAAVLVGMTLNYLNNAAVAQQYAGRAYSTGVNTTNINATNNNFEGAGNVYIPISGNGRVPQFVFPGNTSNSQNVSLGLV